MQVYRTLVLNLSIEYRRSLRLRPSQYRVRISWLQECSGSFYRFQTSNV